MQPTTEYLDTLMLPRRENFEEDLKRHLIKDLLERGFKVPEKENPFEIAVLFYGVLLREIPQRTRRVLWSAELRNSDVAIRHGSALKQIEAESVAGENLNPRTSRQQRKAAFHDRILNVWGVHHLHLGAPGADRRGFAGGTKELLFVMVRPDLLYFVDVLDHNVFENTDLRLLEIVHTNWPDLIEPFRAPRTQLIGPQLLPKHRADLRKSGLSTLTGMPDGTAYYAPGGDITLSGANFIAVRRACSLLNRVTQLHRWCERHVGDIVKMIHREKGIMLESLRGLHLRLDGKEQFILDEEKSGAEIRVVFPREEY